MKYGILTINDKSNYGNRLQNFALQEILKKYGQVETINNVYGLYNKNYKQRIINKLKYYMKKMMPVNPAHIRSLNFENFEKHIKKSKYLIDKEHIPEKIQNKYDKFIIGSDQVWNPYFERMSKIDFALFAPKEKVISYAASFGVNDIPEDKKREYINGLNNVSKISVREESGAKIVRELTGRDAQVVLDPTLLLEKKEWKEVIKKPRNIPTKKYILTYFLGNISEERRSRLAELAKKNDYEIVNLGKIEYPEYFIAGPSEFLWYFENAKIIFTDSFHACVFSIIFDKTFYYMNREDKEISMNSRIETLFKTFELEDRKFENWKNVILEHNYLNVGEILKREKEKSLKFLEDVFLLVSATDNKVLK